MRVYFIAGMSHFVFSVFNNFSHATKNTQVATIWQLFILPESGTFGTRLPVFLTVAVLAWKREIKK